MGRFIKSPQFVVRVYKVLFEHNLPESSQLEERQKQSCWRSIQSYLLIRAEEEQVTHDDCMYENWILQRKIPLKLSQNGDSLVARIEEPDSVELDVAVRRA